MWGSCQPGHTGWGELSPCFTTSTTSTPTSPTSPSSLPITNCRTAQSHVLGEAGDAFLLLPQPGRVIVTLGLTIYTIYTISITTTFWSVLRGLRVRPALWDMWKMRLLMPRTQWLRLLLGGGTTFPLCSVLLSQRRDVLWWLTWLPLTCFVLVFVTTYSLVQDYVMCINNLSMNLLNKNW